MRFVRALSVMALAALAILLLVRAPAGQDDLASVMRRHHLTAGVIAYGPPGQAPRILTFNAHKGKIYNFWSLSKPITAAAVLTGVQRGLIRLDENYEGATVADLLRHAGGWDRDVAGDPVHDRKFPPRCIDMPVPPRQFAPGTKAAYSNVGYCLLGHLIEDRFGQPYREVVGDMFPETVGMGYDEWLGPAGGWSGTAEQYFAFASREVDPRVMDRPAFALLGPYYGLGWRVLDDGTLSHYGVLTHTPADQYTVVFKRSDWVAVGLFSGMPTDWEAARTDLLAAMRALSQ